ncbi:hypothetical protein BDN70DRAFT_877659 [Pholiota conissans]|uniref:Uncharacterized protein n=1 Tax=Pholiota conissans TaxID=109636 RepID=A0A9P5Z6M5_9AGAR|nr:hypothetical protein BDN70DRAFT_877659 [Pholiota conissans]
MSSTKILVLYAHARTRPCLHVAVSYSDRLHITFVGSVSTFNSCSSHCWCLDVLLISGSSSASMSSSYTTHERSAQTSWPIRPLISFIAGGRDISTQRMESGIDIQCKRNIPRRRYDIYIVHVHLSNCICKFESSVLHQSPSLPPHPLVLATIHEGVVRLNELCHLARENDLTVIAIWGK